MELKITDLHLSRGDRLLIKDLNFKLSKGQSLKIEGANGVGKTTLIRAIAGFITPDKGKINFTFDNKDLSKREQIHYIGHKNGIRTSLTVLENLEFWASFYNTQPSLMQIAQTYALKSLLHIPAGYLSAGQKRRLSLSRLSMSKRPLWLLDEPTVSLDQQSVKLVANAAQNHIEEGGILIAATHIPLEIEFTNTLTLSKQTDQAWEALI